MTTALDPVTLLIVDDEAANLDSLVRLFAKEGYRAVGASTGAEALEVIRRESIPVMITDLMMPGMSGVELLRAAHAVSPDTEVVLMTAYGTVETAVEAMKEGAYDFVTKPLKRHAIVKTVKQALEKQSLVTENKRLKTRLEEVGPGGNKRIIGQSPAFRLAFDLVKQAAPSTATVLLQGENGTGKELFARAIHDLSQRAEGPFVAINCAAIPESLLESELFGHEKGAFTGAVTTKPGRFERANHGTLFLDEVGEMTPAAQVKLLRVLQESEFERLGGTSSIKVDVRVVAATNKDLQREVAEGRFREDLYYRLNVVALKLPPLHSRREDLPLLADHFLRIYCQKNAKTRTGFTPQAMELLESYAWPGNVRELENAVERAVVLSKGETIGVDDLPESVRGGMRGSAQHLVIPIGTPLEEIERRVIHETLRHTKGDKTLAAQLLGIAARTIYRKLERETSEAEPAPGDGENKPS
ncbi:MAG: sigma-54-dependent Fis family transcriptional regulator [Deltaproteobacteria bacterium]|nr:sigma-54-dependent Fis family transcriptional regulator [Deltaproteobacteria bacterium]